MQRNFRHGKYRGPVLKIRNPKFEFDEDKARYKEQELMQKETDITSPGTNPVKREFYEENYFEKKKKMNVENRYLKNSLENNPYYMNGSETAEPEADLEEGSAFSARSSSKDSAKLSKMHETAKGFFERNNLQGTKDLSKYDCWDQDLTPQEWIERCDMYPERTHASCPFYINGQYVWKPVKVLSYDPNSKRFLVKQVEFGTQKHVERLSLLFDEEDRNLFRDRVQQCKFYQKRAEDEMRFQTYAEKVEPDLVSNLNKTWIRNILQKALAKGRKLSSEDSNHMDMLALKMVKTVEAEYTREMKKCFVLSEMLDKNSREKFAPLKIELRKEVKHLNYYGTIGVLPSQQNFEQTFDQLQSRLIVTNADRRQCLTDFATKSAEKISTDMFNYNIPANLLPMSNLLFINTQTHFNEEANKTMKNLWRESQLTTISSVPGFNLNFNKEDYKTSKKPYEDMQRFVKRMDLFFRNNVKTLAEGNISSYIKFVRQFVMADPDIDREIWPVSRKPLLTLTIKTKSFTSSGGEKKKHSNEECIFFEPSEADIMAAVRGPLEMLLTSINGISTLESNIFRTLNNGEEKPIYPVDGSTPSFKDAFAQVDSLMERAFKEPLRIINKFREYAYLLKKSSEDVVKQYLRRDANAEGGKDKKSKERKSVEELDAFIQTVENGIRDIQGICTNEKNTIFFMLQTKDLKKTLIDKANEIRTALLTQVSKDSKDNVSKIQDSFDKLSKEILTVPTDEKMYEVLMTILENPDKGHEKTIEKLEGQIDECGKYFDLLLKYNRDSRFDNDTYFFYWALKKYPGVIRTEARDAKSRSINICDVFQNKVKEDKITLMRKISKLEKEFEYWKKLSYEEWAKRAFENSTFQEEIDNTGIERDTMNQREMLLGATEASAFENYTTLMTAYEPYKIMRSIGVDFEGVKSNWEQTSMVKLRYKEVAQKVDRLTKDLERLMKRFEFMEDSEEAYRICKQIEANIVQFKMKMPIIRNLTKDAILKKSQYWKEILEKTGLDKLGLVQATITLADLISPRIDILQHLEVLEDICIRAEKEYSLEQKYTEEVLEVLKKQRLETVPHNNTGTTIITGVDEMMQLLDDKLTLLIVMKQNPNIKPIKADVERTEKKLRGCQDMFDEWVKCQRDWIYLEPIFSSDEIAKEMPQSSKLFDDVDRRWRQTMLGITQDDLIFENSDLDRLTQNLHSNNIELDKIQKSLNTYLGSKRKEFPRFYFLADDELLEILSKGKDPTLVTKYMKKCFEAIEYIDFSPKLEVLNMKSSEKEVVDFLRPIPTSEGDKKISVEKWLTGVEGMMRETLIKVSINCANDTTERTKWVFKWPGQVIIAVNNIRWTAGVEEAINESSIREYLDQLVNEREEIVDMVKGEITPLQRMTLGALIVIDQHAIYVVEMLIQNGIDTKTDFDWISQLRYYMDHRDKDNIKVKMITSTLSYQYEYLGNSDRLVITPLTDRCYRTLMGAFQYNYGGAPEGPAGTGKTETVKDLAKAIAVQCVVFNCSDQINYVAMSKFFKGLSQCGAWCCFDEFNRIEPEVLSVIAEQVRTIQIAIKKGGNNFIFEGVECRLKPSAFTCITMNPGYAGRSELPDNLKALFRPCAMMVPDYSLISEIVLFSYGYQTATVLAKKIVASLRLSSEQLSTQKHYDFGMRALKAILVAAGNLKKKNQEEDEDRLCIRALFDVNLPKFTQNDIPLFNSITSDLFTDTKPPVTDYTMLLQMIETLCDQKQLMPEPVIKKKCIETYETLLVRHGLMLVGQTCSAKTVVFNLLRDSLTALNGVKDYVRVRDFWLNPKAFDSFQLFGKLDTNTKLWTDGVLPQIMRFCENDNENPERKWIVFDGPVDAVWIENMNTVLDDNKILCLTNGQKIKVTPQMNMMFEVEDLDNASPATVSRCGMVYLEPRQLGWKPLVSAYTKYKLVPALKGMQKFLEMTLMWMLVPVLEFVRKNSKFPFLVDNLQMVTHVLKIFDSMCAQFKSPEYNEQPKEGKEGEALINNYCLFSVLWGVGGVIEDSRSSFNKFLLKLVYFDDVRTTFNLDIEEPGWEPRGLNYNLGDINNLYEILFDPQTNQWTPWMKTIAKWVPPKPDAAYNELIVPTSDTIRNSYLINLMIMNKHHILLTGPTGTAKTISATNEINTNYRSKSIGNIMMVFSGQTSANQVQTMIEGKMTRVKKGYYEPDDGKQKLVIFIDDVNMPQKEIYGAQPPIELLRMWCDHGFWYDLVDRERKYLSNMQLLCTMGPPSSGRNMITRRFLRHFFILFTEPFDEKSLTTIFTSIMDWYFLSMKGKLPSSIEALKGSVIDATIKVYNKVINRLLPTPKKSHYIYNLRDVSRVIQGITKANIRSFTDPNDLIKLWGHECMRVFSDRLVSKEDQHMFNEDILKNVMNEVFKKPWSTVVKVEPLLFGSFIPTRYPDNDTSKPAYQDVYCELTNRENLVAYSEKYLDKYNEGGSTNDNGEKDKLNLVLFMTALEHLVRIVRILGTSYGHALLVGIGGSGKKSLAKLATYIVDYDRFSIEVHKNYDYKKDWPESLQKLLRKCGVENRPTTFLFTDSQIFKEAVLEDISSILNQGEVPNLFPPEMKAKITEDLSDAFPQETEPMNQNQRFEFFIKNCKKNLHLVLCFSPVGELFRKRLRTFPSLINCTTIDWFMPWPNEALKSVALALLKSSNLVEDELEKVSDIFVTMQDRVVNLSKQYLDELRKYFYVTPTSYIELVNTFKRMLTQRLSDSQSNIFKYRTGLEKISSAENEVQVKRKELEELKPQLQESTEYTEKLLVRVQKEQIEADKEKLICQADQIECNKIKDEANKLKAECQIDLDQAEVILQEAKKNLDKIDRKDIDLLRTMRSLTEPIKLLFKALCIIRRVDVKMIKDPDDPFKKIPDYMTPVRLEIMKDANKMVKMLQSYDEQKITEDLDQGIIDNLSKLMKTEPFFTHAKVKNATESGGAMYLWMESIIQVWDKLLFVNPKRQDLKVAQAQVESAEATLKQKIDNLNRITEMIDTLKNTQREAEDKKVQLKNDVARCKRQLEAAEELTKGFTQEKDTWNKRATILVSVQPNILGECLLASGVVAYLGAFPMEYRNKSVESWTKTVREKHIKVPEEFSLRKICADDLTVNNWIDKYKLPNDAISIENAIIIKESSRYPLIIDPQLQATKWIYEMYGGRLKVVRSNSNAKETPHLIQMCIQEGFPLLAEAIEEYVDPMYSSLFDQIKEYEGKSLTMKFMDKFYDLNENFKFFATTKMSNPHYPPEICAKVTLINFTVTVEGLEDQLINTAVAIEYADLEARRQKTIKRNYELTKKQVETEALILNLLSKQEGNILDNEELIATLNESKKDQNEAAKELENIERTKKKYNDTCALFKEVGFRCSNLFFCVMDMSNVEPMYQFSLEWFIELYKDAVRAEPRVKETRNDDIIRIFRDSLFLKVCRSLFEKDKLLFSFLIYLKKLLCDGATTNGQIRELLLNVVTKDAPTPNPHPQWLSQKQWNQISELNRTEAFKGLLDDFVRFGPDWQKIYDSSTPQTMKLPDRWDKVNSVQRLILIKLLRADKLVPAVQNEITSVLGKHYVEFETFSLETVHKDSASQTPIIFILSPGSDPLTEIMKLSTKPIVGANVQALSLGQGQEKAAENAINRAKKEGEWVVLQNCHLAPGFLSNIERSMEPAENGRYRLWLTSMPTNKFPVTILQNGIKVTNEPPRGIKASLLKSYMAYDNKFLEDLKDPRNVNSWKKLIFSLSFFHAIILERRKFGALGWNIPYMFSQMDMSISLSQVKTFLENQPDVEWKALHYLIAEANYGGRVTDPMDRRLINVILKTYFCDEVLQDGYKFSDSGIYYAPPAGNQESYLEYIRNVLPLNDEPEVFGLHANANITSGLNDTNEMLSKALELQPQISDGGASSTDNLIKKKCAEILESLPAKFDLEEADKLFPVRYDESMNTVLQQELIRYNNLLNTIKSTLSQLEKAIEGTIIMSVELEEIYNKMYIYQVPEAWHKVSYPSLKPLTSWIEDFLKRMAFMNDWLQNGQPKAFWISGFFFTQSFLTGTSQNYARQTKKEIDTIIFDYKVLNIFDLSEVSERPEFGSYIYGLYLEGANFSLERHCLEESAAKVLYNKMPMIWLIPVQLGAADKDANRRVDAHNNQDYTCPVYKTSKRAGTLSTTGHSTNYVLSIDLPMNKQHKQQHWIKRGAALLCQLDD